MNVAYIPVRGGSKSIPMKNIKEILGYPLVYWVVLAASECKYIDVVYVSTDSVEIADVVRKFKLNKVEVIGRSAESASDSASTEFAMLEFAERYEFENIVLIQATSPLLLAENLNEGFELFMNSRSDSVLSVVKQYRFIWENDEQGYAFAKNYDVSNRPRRQDFGGYLMENGAFYITKKECLMRSRCRISGNIVAYEMPPESAVEIDEPSDFIIVEELMRIRSKKKTAKCNIKAFLTDCDGCLTDGGMYYSEKGDELKKFNTRDGVAFSLFKKAGIATGIITSERVKLNERRANKIGVDYFFGGVNDKLGIVKKLCNELGLSLDEIAYLGDDLNDLEVIRNVGMSFCPADAVAEIKRECDFVCLTMGGKGVVREVYGVIKNM